MNTLKDVKKELLLLLKKVIKFIKAISLNEIRNGIKNFHPPQSYYTINDNLQTIILDFLPKKSLRHFL